MLEEINLMIRGALIGVSFLAFLILWSNKATKPKSFSVGAIAVALAGHMAQHQGISQSWSPAAANIAYFFAHMMPLALTWFVLDVFLEKPERREIGRGLMALATVVVALCFAPKSLAGIQFALSIVLDLGLLYAVLRSAQGDLVENRRSFRVVFVTLMITFGITKAVLDAFFDVTARPALTDTIYAVILLSFAIVFAHWALRPGGDIWAEGKPVRPGNPVPADPADSQTIARIDTAMRDEIWRREGLTIGEMAEELSIPEHRLRKAINRDLGFRNFSSFVNEYRIDAAKSALAAPENARRTILEIAFECGFASLAPFNRAFRAYTGQSPRDFRKDAIGDLSSISG